MQRDALRRLTLRLLEPDAPAHSLRPEVLEIAAILAGDGPRAAEQTDIARGETRTSDGLALSPTMAAMCVDDFARTVKFVRGAHAAIVAARERCLDRPARVLYVGCGPYATLAAPLMTVLPPREAQFTLLDIHPEAVESAKSVVARLQLVDSVTRFEITDATSYEVSAEIEPDVVLVETMQACLEAEPQVAIARNLLKRVPDAILVPEEVRVDLVLVNPSREFALHAPEQGEDRSQRGRVAVAPVFTLNRETVAAWVGLDSERLPASDVQLPAAIDERYEPMLFTTVRVYGSHVLEDYESGLTCPRRLSLERPIEPGDIVHFQYTLGSHPRLEAQVCKAVMTERNSPRHRPAAQTTTANRFLRLPLTFSPESLREDLERCLRVEWPAHFNQRDYSGAWSSIALRSRTGAIDDIQSVPEQSEYRDTALLAECPYFRAVLDGLLCAKETVRLLRLEAGSVIHEHCDPGASYADGFFRLHVPITSNAGTRFTIAGEVLEMQPGECWYVDFGLPHSVRNDGDTARVHLVIDGLRNGWSDELFGRAGYDFDEEARRRPMDPDTLRLVIETLRSRATETDLRLADELERNAVGQ